MKASENGHVEAVKVLSEKGAELNLQNGVSGGSGWWWCLFSFIVSIDMIYFQTRLYLCIYLVDHTISFVL